MKGLTSKAGRHLQLDETTLAGTSNFFAAGVASSVTNLISVPVDVIAQRQMVYSDIMKHQRAEGSPRPVSQPSPGGIHPSWPAGDSVASDAARPAADRKAMPGPSPRPTVSAVSVAGSPHSAVRKAVGDSAAGPSGRAEMHSLPSSTSQVSHWRKRPSHGSSLQLTPRVTTTSIPSRSLTVGVGFGQTGGGPGALSIIRDILKEEGIVGFYRGFGASLATFVPSSAIWWGSYGETLWKYKPPRRMLLSLCTLRNPPIK